MHQLDRDLRPRLRHRALGQPVVCVFLRRNKQRASRDILRHETRHLLDRPGLEAERGTFRDVLLHEVDVARAREAHGGVDRVLVVALERPDERLPAVLEVAVEPHEPRVKAGILVLRVAVLHDLHDVRRQGEGRVVGGNREHEANERVHGGGFVGSDERPLEADVAREQLEVLRAAPQRDREAATVEALLRAGIAYLSDLDHDVTAVQVTQWSAA